MTAKRCFILFLVIALCLTLPGCLLAPAIDSFSKAGVTPGDRERLLPKEVKHYQDALYWGNMSEAMNFANETGRPQVAEAFKQRGHDERIVDSKVESIEFSDNSFKAEVRVEEKFYKVPFYLVTSRTQKQLWDFTLMSGWKLSSQAVESPSTGNG